MHREPGSGAGARWAGPAIAALVASAGACTLTTDLDGLAGAAGVGPWGQGGVGAAGGAAPDVHAEGAGGGASGAEAGETSAGGADTSAPDASGAVAQLCVDLINQRRASIGRPPLARWSAIESCADGQAKTDAATNTPHGAFGVCAEMKQNECPGWPGTPQTMIEDCLQMMWNEGPGGGHYENMASTKLTRVACGFHVTSTATVWAVQDFQ